LPDIANITKSLGRFVFIVKRDFTAEDEEGIRVKEQAILELGSLFAKKKQADGKAVVMLCYQLFFFLKFPVGFINCLRYYIDIL
jgi:hypothetical protein